MTNFCCCSVPGRHCAVQSAVHTSLVRSGQSWRVTQLNMIRVMLVLLALLYPAHSSLARDETNSQKIQSLLGDYNDFYISSLI